MTRVEYRKSHSNAWLLAFASITAVSVALFLVTYFIDTASQSSGSFYTMLFSAEAHGVLSNMPEVIAGILGITITVVAIIVELASNRYTPRVTELFVRTPINLIVLGFFVVTGLLCIWVSYMGASSEYIPRVGTVVAFFAITICMLVLLPYFAFVFAFLNPHNIIEHMGHSVIKAIKRGQRGDAHRRQRAKFVAVQGIEQLADVALNAIEKKDKGICMHAIDTLGNLSQDYLAIKKQMPDAWFRLEDALRENPDFVSLQADVLNDIEEGHFWFEMKVMRQYQMLYGETLNRMRDINYLIAINTRKLAEKSLDLKQEQATILMTKFFNTFLRATVNERDVRTAYNVLNQYRLLAETSLKRGRWDMAVEATRRFKYYGQLGFGMGLPFVLETAAYDLCALNELAFDLDVPCRDEILSIFLEVDKEAEEGHVLEASLRGVRKAQVKLATYYLKHDAVELARAIFEDMRGELPKRLASIQEELANISSQDFWEMSDRGVNFDYLEPERRAMLARFFGWFSG
jgi:hypothetical protein